jgi:3-phenylpropionate/trans-cinnamate dioxygenase ferredoxin component
MTAFVPVATLDQLPPGKSRMVFAQGKVFALFNVGGEVYALDDACPHQGSSLGAGKFDGAVVTCRAHGMRFDVRTGRMPGVDGLRATPCRVQVVDRQIAIGIDLDSCSHSTGETQCTAT